MNLLPSQKTVNPLSRRRFLSRVGCGAMGMTGMVNTLAHLKLMQGALNAQGGGGGYKALVCVFLGGGNDSNNMLIPLTGTARNHYQGAGTANTPGRGRLTIPAPELHPLTTVPAHITAASPISNYLGTFGLHPQLGGMSDMFNNGELAFVANVGTLTRPGITRANYATSSRPPQLFSHSDQVTQWQSSVPDQPFKSGWGGRVADYLNPLHNPGEGNASMSISISGVNSFQTSASGSVTPYVMTSNGVVSLSGYGTNYTGAVNNAATLFDDSNYQNTDAGYRLRTFERIMRYTNDSLLENAYNGVVTNARLTEGMVGTALTATAAGNASTLDVHFSNAFAGAEVPLNNTFTNQMKLVARLISGRSALGNNRQIFFVQLGGFDTHTTQIPAGNPATPAGNPAGGHTGLMNTLNRTLKGFRDALIAEGTWDSVVAFSASDFTRTFTANKTDASAGSDHGWGGHHFALGGPVEGGRVYGKFPVLLTGQITNSMDATGSSGRWIPTTSVDQYSAVLGNWLGVPTDALNEIFPNLSRFTAPPFDAILQRDQSPNLGFLNPA